MAEPTTPVVPFSGVWGDWCRWIDSVNLGPDNQQGYDKVNERLRAFSLLHHADPGHVDGILMALYRGVPLMQAAYGWEHPVAGQRAEKPSPSDTARGEQWRFVMAYGGFETVARALLVDDRPGNFEPRQFRSLIRECPALTPYKKLPPPALSEKAQEKWLQPDLPPDHPMIRFLGIAYTDALSIRNWLVGQQPITTWEGALEFAQALRNVTVHGALSASKVKEWKLTKAFGALVETLVRVVGAALRRLVEAPVGK